MAEGGSGKKNEHGTSEPSKDGEEGAVGGVHDVISQSNMMDYATPKFIIPSGKSSGSPPHFVRFDEVMNVADGIQNMQLAHEIAVQKDFRLEKYEPPQNSLEKTVTEMIHKAFWDVLKEELNANPPIYNKAMLLLGEIKETVLEMLMPQHSKIKQEITEVLDIPLVKQQAEHGSLDFLSYARYILSVMGKLCAPVRDERIIELQGATDVVVLYKGIFEVLSLMKLDLANLHIQMMRPALLTHSVEYERSKFAEILRADGGLDSLVITKKWLKEGVDQIQKPPLPLDSGAICDLAVKVIPHAYLNLLEWEERYPETVMMDKVRLNDLKENLFRLSVMGGALLVTLSKLNIPILQTSQQFKDTLRDNVTLLLQDIQTDKDLEQVVPNVALQVIQEAKKFLKEHAPDVTLDAAAEKSITDIIMDFAKPEQPVRNLVRLRIKEFFASVLAGAPDIPTTVPPGLVSMKADLLSMAATLIHIYTYNRAVFGQYYLDIITKLCRTRQ